jgi:predicted RNase H-related nuclease YkuK (DUF458 family)
MSTQWKTLDGARIESIYDQLRETFQEAYDNDEDCMVYVGTDSQNMSRNTSFVQVVAVHIFRSTGTGSGGRVFYVRHLERRYTNRRERLLREAELSINLAQKINPVCEEYGIDFEVHADVHSSPGANGENKSYEVHDAVKGWIQGLGYECVTKPGAFVASIVADRHTRGVRSHRPLRKSKTG